VVADSLATVFVTDTIVSGFGTALFGSTIVEDFNLFFGNLSNTTGAASGGHSVVANPLFVNPAPGDFHLTLASPARDAGIDVGLRTDFDGNQRPIGGACDIGFDEFAFPNNLFLPFVRR
jgi:hypothetical protein